MNSSHKSLRTNNLPLSPEDAWKLWNQLSDITSILWDAYEQPFLDFCINDCETPKTERIQEQPDLPF